MFHQNIEDLTKENENFRKVICTGKYTQLVLMTIPVGGEIGEEVHPDTDQLLFLVEGQGQAVIEGQPSDFNEDDVVFVPAGTKHNFINNGSEDLKLYTVYGPPEHAEGTVHKTFEDAKEEN